MKMLSKIFWLSIGGALAVIVSIYFIVYFFTIQFFETSIAGGSLTYSNVDFYDPAQDLAVRVTAVAAPIVFFAYLLILFVCYGFFNTLNRIIRTTKRIAGGDLTRRFNAVSRDESGDLANAFNEMTDRLHELYVGLDKLVKDRTAMLVVRMRELQFEKAKIEAILQSIGDGMVVVSSTGRVMLMNNHGERMLGVKVNEVTGKVFNQFIREQEGSGDMLPDEKRSLSRSLRGEWISTAVDLRNVTYFIKTDGTRFPVGMTCSPIRINEEVIGAIAIFRDVTHELEVDKMKTEFISLASHQLRTPLSAIKWFSEMLLAGDAGKLTTEQEEFAKNISESTERMIDLVRGLLNISRMESGRIIIDPKITDLVDMVKGLIEELKVKIIEKDQKLIISAHESLPKINVDQRLIRQVYLNLLTNAIKYTPSGGEITVFISRKGEEIISQVSDTGYGIPLNQQSRMFEKFFRADNVAKFETDGTGLGLYLVKEIIMASGGRIWFHSDEGKGTTFWFSLPIAGTPSKKGEVALD